MRVIIKALGFVWTYVGGVVGVVFISLGVLSDWELYRFSGGSFFLCMLIRG